MSISKKQFSEVKYQNLVDSILEKYKTITPEKKNEMQFFMKSIYPNTFSKKEIQQTITNELFKTMERVNTFQYQYYICLGHSEEQAKKIISQRQSNNSKKLSDKKKNNPEKYVGILQTQLSYWIKKGFSEEEAKKKLAERQSTFSKEKCIQRYGYIEGMQRWQERQEKWQNSLCNNPNTDRINKSKGKTFCQLEKKFGTEKAKNIIQSRTSRKCAIFGRASKESLKYFVPLYKWLRRRGYEKFDVLWGIGGSQEKMIWDTTKRYFFDFTIESISVIIEFNGIGFHPKSRYQKDWKPIFGDMLCNEVYSYDRKKINRAKKEGYRVLEIWSDEPLKLDKMKKFIVEMEKR